MHKYTFLIIATCVIACHAWTSPLAMAQAPQDWDVASGDWNVGGNWTLGVVPDGPGFGETARITNGGTATLSGAASFDPGGVAVGPGTLELTTSGDLSVVDASGVDAAATGFFGIGGGGTLSLVGNASVTADGSVSLNGSTNITGPNVTLTTQNDLNFGLTSVYNANINSATHSVLSADGSSTLRGTLNVVFSGGVTPGLGSTWTLVDATSITGNFGTVNISGATLGLGQVLGVTTSAGGSNGTIAQLGVQERLVLRVDRALGTTTLLNPGNAAISIEGYSVRSAIGTLAPQNGNWNSLEDQSVANWVETASSSNGLGELESSIGGSLAIASGGGQRALGSAFSPLLPFGSASPEDLVFEYRDATEGVLTGVVQYVGAVLANNLVLTVDPATGNAQVRNASPTISVDLQGYTITSANGSLLASFDSNLPSSDWAETAGSANGVGELNLTTGSTTLAPNDTFDLTGVFSPGEVEDLVFQFRREVALDGDFNEDGTVDGADLTGSAASWDSRYGADLDGSNFLAWQRNLGDSGTAGDVVTGIVRYDGAIPVVAATTAVPEPASGLMMLLAIAVVPSIRRIRSSRVM